MAQKTKAYLKTRFETKDRPTQSDFEDLIDSAQPTISTVSGGTLTDNEDGSQTLTITGGTSGSAAIFIQVSALNTTQLNTQITKFQQIFQDFESNKPIQAVINVGSKELYTLTGILTNDTNSPTVGAHLIFKGIYTPVFVDGVGDGVVDIYVTTDSGSLTGITAISSVTTGSTTNKMLAMANFEDTVRNPFAESSETAQTSEIIGKMGAQLDVLGNGKYLRIIRDEENFVNNLCFLYNYNNALNLGFIIQFGDDGNLVSFFNKGRMNNTTIGGDIPTNPTDAQLLSICKDTYINGDPLILDDIVDNAKAYQGFLAGIPGTSDYGNAYRMWTGTETQYNAVTSKDATTFYFVTGKGIYLGTTKVAEVAGSTGLVSGGSLDYLDFSNTIQAGRYYTMAITPGNNVSIHLNLSGFPDGGSAVIKTYVSGSGTVAISGLDVQVSAGVSPRCNFPLDSTVEVGTTSAPGIMCIQRIGDSIAINFETYSVAPTVHTA